MHQLVLFIYRYILRNIQYSVYDNSLGFCLCINLIFIQTETVCGQYVPHNIPEWLLNIYLSDTTFGSLSDNSVDTNVQDSVIQNNKMETGNEF